MKAIVLLSGGLDSTVCMAVAKEYMSNFTKPILPSAQFHPLAWRLIRARFLGLL